MTMANIDEDKKSVCIIGGGPFGLNALRRVLESEKLTGTLFEQKDDVGGLWNFKGDKHFRTSPANLSKLNEKDPEEWTGMYSNLTTNAPYKILELQDFPHPAALHNDPVYHTFRTQEQIHDYFRDYAKHFSLWPHIQLHTAVTRVRPEENVDLGADGTPCRWLVTTHNHKDDVYDTKLFDAVMVCTGKNTVPYMASFPGLETFQGQVLHSKYFESAAEFSNKDVVCIGFGGSSADLALHLSETAKSVTICHKFPDGFKFGLLPPNVREIPNVKEVTEMGIISESGEEIHCDVIILCSGYSIKFPFFNDDINQVPEVIGGKYVPHLYNMTVFSKRPSLAILNMCYRVPEVMLTDVQSRYFVSVLEGRHQLPTYAEMEHQLKLYVEEKIKQNQPCGLWLQVGHFGFGGISYFRAIAEQVGFAEDCCREWPLKEGLWVTALGRLLGKLAFYKSDRFRIVDENTWEYEFCSEMEDPSKRKREKIVMTMDPVSRQVTTETLEATCWK